MKLPERLTRPSAFALRASADEPDTLSPSGGEGWGERVRFMEKEIERLRRGILIVCGKEDSQNRR